MADPLLARGNRYRFAPGEIVEAGPVDARSQIWCRRGRGELWVDDQAFPITPGSLFLLPWGRRMRYRAARRDPCDLLGLHLVPRPTTAGGDRPAANDPWPIARRLPEDHPLFSLGAYALALVDDAEGDPEARRLTARLLWREWQRLARDEDEHDLAAPLQRVAAAQRARLAQPLGLAEAARIAGCSSATLTRYCRAQLGRAPASWLRELRLAEAVRRLRESGEPAGRIARDCGFRDGDHLARCLRRSGRDAPRALRHRYGRGP